MSTIALARPHSRAPRPPRIPKPKPLPNIPFPTFEDIPDVFAMKLAGDCLAPELMDGDDVVFTKAEAPRAGDIAIFILRPEEVREGGYQSLIKRLVLGIPPWVTFPWRENPKSEVRALAIAAQSNPPRQYMIPCERLLAVLKFSHVQRRAQG